MSYQLCRWYDPYPRLAFALKMLYLSPGAVQVKAAREMQRFIAENWATPQRERAHYEAAGAPRGKRWYDEDADTAQAVELIRNSPTPLKSRVADTLLAILVADCA